MPKSKIPPRALIQAKSPTAPTTPPAIQRRRRGGQPANQNARTSGIYSEALTPEEETTLAVLAAKPDMLDEIALLRLVIRRAAMQDEDGSLLEKIAAGVDVLTRTMKVNKSLSGETARQFETALAQVLDSLADEMGLK
jgi:hypothetical protein